jgi:hypothetical protein
MKGQSALDAIVLQEGLAAGDFLENFRGEVAVEKEAEMRFVQGGVVEKGYEDVRGGMVEKSC